MDFISILSIFVLACFVGYFVVWSVTPALHTPLMAVTNAISSVIIVGALIAAAATGAPLAKWLGLAAVVMASINIFGGFAVTAAHARNVQEEGARADGARTPPRPPGCCSPIWSRASASSSPCAGCRARPARARGNRFGMFGMTLAVVTTLVHYRPFARRAGRAPGCSTISTGRWPARSWRAIAVGAVIGIVTARRIAMTAMPQLVAAFHSLVGMAAVLVGAGAFLNPQAFGIAGPDGVIHLSSRIEMGLGVAIGAITFSGSVIAFLKLNGNMSGKPIMLPMRHVINLGTLVAILGLIGYFTQDQSAVDLLDGDRRSASRSASC